MAKGGRGGLRPASGGGHQRNPGLLARLRGGPGRAGRRGLAFGLRGLALPLFLPRGLSGLRGLPGLCLLRRSLRCGLGTRGTQGFSPRPGPRAPAAPTARLRRQGALLHGRAALPLVGGRTGFKQAEAAPHGRVVGARADLLRRGPGAEGRQHRAPPLGGGLVLGQGLRGVLDGGSPPGAAESPAGAGTGAGAGRTSGVQSSGTWATATHDAKATTQATTNETGPRIILSLAGAPPGVRGQWSYPKPGPPPRPVEAQNEAAAANAGSGRRKKARPQSRATRSAAPPRAPPGKPCCP
jgi:hypothetical protein